MIRRLKIAGVSLAAWGLIVIPPAGAGVTGDASPAVTSAAVAPAPQARPAEWAQPLILEGLPNLHKVAEGLYRGAQPTAAGFEQLKRLGVRTVIDLRVNHSDQDLLPPAGMRQEVIPMQTWHVDAAAVERFLAIVADSNRAPVFVHCQHGADRTGLMCAIYRVVVCNWDKESAIREMTQGGFGFHPIWLNLAHAVRTLDADALRQALAARQPAASGGPP